MSPARCRLAGMAPLGAAGSRNYVKDIEQQQYNRGLRTPARVHWPLYAAAQLSLDWPVEGSLVCQIPERHGSADFDTEFWILRTSIPTVRPVMAWLILGVLPRRPRTRAARRTGRMPIAGRGSMVYRCPIR